MITKRNAAIAVMLICAATIGVLIATGDKESDMVEVGKPAPDFTLKNQDGKAITLSKHKGEKNVVLVFYPKDETPGCTKQLCAIRDDFQEFTDKGIVVYGVNKDSAKSHKKFIANQNYQFDLLVDSDGKVVEKYGCSGSLWVKRTVYGIGKDGNVVFAQRGMPNNDKILAAFGE